MGIEDMIVGKRMRGWEGLGRSEGMGGIRTGKGRVMVGKRRGRERKKGMPVEGRLEK